MTHRTKNASKVLKENLEQSTQLYLKDLVYQVDFYLRMNQCYLGRS